MRDISSTLNFISLEGEPINWIAYMEGDEDKIEAISSDDRIVVIVNATAITVGAAGTGEAGLRSDLFWFDVVGHHVEGAYNGIIQARKLIEKEKNYRITNKKPYSRWYEGMMATLMIMATDSDCYNEATEVGFYSYFDMTH